MTTFTMMDNGDNDDISIPELHSNLLQTLWFLSKLYQDVSHGLLQHHIKFHPDQLKSVQENEANGFCFALTLWPPAKADVTESGMKMVEVNSTDKHSKNEKNVVVQFVSNVQH